MNVAGHDIIANDPHQKATALLAEDMTRLAFSAWDMEEAMLGKYKGLIVRMEIRARIAVVRLVTQSSGLDLVTVIRVQ